LTLNGLHGVISQKLILFITTAVKTSNPKKSCIIAVCSRKGDRPGHTEHGDFLSFRIAGINNVPIILFIELV
jgi:hypothetical protein